MRELEFLPEWYPRLRRCKRMLVLQAWLTLAIVGGLGLWIGLVQRNIRSAQAAVTALDAQMRQSKTEQQQLEAQMTLKKELSQKEQIIAELGFPVEMSRLLRTLDAIMPREMSLLEISCSTEEVSPPAATSAAAARAKPEKDKQVMRRLKVRLIGVAPTDVDLANFMAALQSEYRFFENVALVRADGRSEGGHLMREFEVTCAIDLDATGQ
jgi:Tfp pilus assembly protein PilN